MVSINIYRQDLEFRIYHQANRAVLKTDNDDGFYLCTRLSMSLLEHMRTEMQKK